MDTKIIKLSKTDKEILLREANERLAHGIDVSIESALTHALSIVESDKYLYLVADSGQLRYHNPFSQIIYLSCDEAVDFNLKQNEITIIPDSFYTSLCSRQERLYKWNKPQTCLILD